jgi:glycosyltransferase involved in cell wall biosynthesis
MKLAVIDNTCNNGYVLMRYLNDLGYDTDLLMLNKGTGHADPGNDTYQFEYFDKIKILTWGRKGLLRLGKKEIHAVLDKYDFVIGADYSPAIVSRINRKLDIFLPHGTDLFNYPFIKLSLNRFSKRNLGEWILASWQRRGIRKFTKYFWFELTNEENESYIRRFSSASFIRIYDTNPQVYFPQYTECNISAYSLLSENVRKIKKLREDGCVIIFHHCQQLWRNPQHSLFNKGNDKLIKGFARFVKSNPEFKMKLVMVERGSDMEASKQLIQELGVENAVLWLPQMPRKEIMSCLYVSDIGVGELGHSWYTYSVVTEFMVTGKPIIHKCDQEYYKKVHDETYPMFSASTEDDIYSLFEEYRQYPQKFVEIGLKAQEWWSTKIEKKFLSAITDLIKQKTGSHS